MSAPGARREEILETAASLFATSGMKTTLQDIADTCGILPGSLYHHFESKEALIVELVHRYRDDLDRIAKESLDGLHEAEQRPVEARVVELGEAIADCAVRHRAALLLTLYEPPSVSGDELVELYRQTPTAIVDSMFEILEAGREAGEIRARIDLSLLAERLCDSMFNVGVGVWHRSQAARGLPAQKCRVLLHGVATRAPKKDELNRSAAMHAANAAIDDWSDGGEDDQASYLRLVARAEFARRGYEATTVRDIAKAAKVSTGTVYRIFGSKDELLLAIMQDFSVSVTHGWEAVLRSPSTPLEQLDALLWVNINMVDRFQEELKIHLAWLRQSPPTSVDIGLPFGSQLNQFKKLIVAGDEAGELTVEGDSSMNRARSLFELVLMPANIVERAGTAGAHAFAREVVLRGALSHR
jgi:AcrR family transcriptional regulator